MAANSLLPLLKEIPSFNANSVNPDQMLRSANVFRANDLICEKNNLGKKNGATFTYD